MEATQGVEPGAHAVRVDAAERACEPTREPDHHVGATAVRREVHHRPIERGQREARRHLAHARTLDLGSYRCGHDFYAVGTLDVLALIEIRKHARRIPASKSWSFNTFQPIPSHVA